MGSGCSSRKYQTAPLHHDSLGQSGPPVTQPAYIANRRVSLGRDQNSNLKIHSQISQSFAIDPVNSLNMPLGQATDEELLAEVARRKLDIHKKITEALVLETYEFLENIGKGASGVVTKVRHRQNGQEFAMKTIHKDTEINDLDSMLTEIDIMKRVRHRHIVCMYELYEVIKNHVYIIHYFIGYYIFYM